MRCSLYPSSQNKSLSNEVAARCRCCDSPFQRRGARGAILVFGSISMAACAIARAHSFLVIVATVVMLGVVVAPVRVPVPVPASPFSVL